MKKNELLNIAISISRILKTLLIVGAVVLTGLLIYVQINKEAFANEEINLRKQTSSISFSSTSESTFGDIDEDEKPYTIGKLKTISLYMFYVKGLIVMALIYLSINAFEKIMLSVKTLKTFSSRNSNLFRDIGKYILFITILTSYSVLRFESVTQTKLSIEFTPLVYVLLAFIMAEIFKEGSILKQENDLTI